MVTSLFRIDNIDVNLLALLASGTLAERVGQSSKADCWEAMGVD